MSAVVETTEVQQEVKPEVVVEPMVGQLNSMVELLDTLAKTSKSLTIEMKALVKDVNKLRLSKGGKKQKRVVDPDVPRKMGALEKPVEITEELCDFLGLQRGEMYSRQVITKTINAYVKDKDLQNPENRRYILLESEDGLKLKALLRDPDQPLTFFNIQRYLKVHYPKTEPVEVSSSSKTVVDLSGDSSSEKVVPVVEKEVKLTSSVVPDSDTVDETVSDVEVPKKKIVRKIVKKVAEVPVVP
jgi:chromatin remodeling complex protein RSC6